MPSEECHYGIFGEIQDEVSGNETFVQIQDWPLDDEALGETQDKALQN